MKKKFAIKLSLISVTILFICFILSHIFHTVVENKNIYTKNYEEYFKSHDQIKFLIMGDSHALEAIDPRLLPSDSFNFSTGGENYIESYYKLNYLIENGKSIDYLIAPIDPHNFTYKHSMDWNYDYFWNKYLNYPEIIVETKDPAVTVNLLQGLFFSYSDRNTIFRILSGTTDTSEFFLGHRVINKKIDQDAVTHSLIEKRANIFFEEEYNQKVFDPKLLNYFQKYISLAKENNIKIIFISYPHYYEYAEFIKQRIDLDAFYTTVIVEIHKSNYEPNIQVLNYFEMYRDNIEYFSDLDHLNQKGAEEFTKLILKDIQDNTDKINYNTEY